MVHSCQKNPSRSGHIEASRLHSPTLPRNVAHLGHHCPGHLDQHAGKHFSIRFKGLVLLLHLLCYSRILLRLIILGDHQPVSEDFGYFQNGGNCSTQGFSYMINLNGAIAFFVGKLTRLDSETKNERELTDLYPGADGVNACKSVMCS